MSSLIDEWKRSGEHPTTRTGNVRPPTNEDMSSWLSTGWNSISTELIVNSFRRCFLDDSMDLHIARHPRYGPAFRIRIAELSGIALPVQSEEPDDLESSIEDIYDE